LCQITLSGFVAVFSSFVHFFFSLFIKTFHIKKGITLLEIANKLNKTEATIQRYESGNIKNLKSDTIEMLANSLGVEPAYLMGWIPEDEEITNRDVTRFHNELLAKFSVSSAKRTHAALSAVLNYAIRQDYLSANVAREVGNIDVKEDKRMEFWTLEEFKKFISVVDDLMYRTFFMTLYFSGMRKGEQLALRWADIDFENNVINVDKTTDFNDITSPKTQSSVRKLKMPQHTMTLLGELKLRFPNKPDYFVFGEVYNHLSETTIDVHYNDYVDEAGVKRIRLHDFRHSHASYLINKGNDIQIVSKRLGHQNTSTTYDVYAHLYPNAEDEAIKNMEDDFKSADVIEISNFR